MHGVHTVRRSFMEITRQALKQRAKSILSVRYWPFFFIGLLQWVITGFGGISINLQGLQNIRNYTAFFTVIGASALLSVLVNIFLANPFRVAYAGFIYWNCDTEKPIDHSVLWRGFKGNYIKAVKTMLMRDFFAALWSIPLYAGVALLYTSVFLKNGEIGNWALYGAGVILIILGGVMALYKDYSYSMTEYALAEGTEESLTGAIKKSKQLMRGYTFFAFKLDISFIGWYLLGAMLCGMGTLFVNPYYNTVKMQFYMALQREAIYE